MSGKWNKKACDRAQLPCPPRPGWGFLVAERELSTASETQREVTVLPSGLEGVPRRPGEPAVRCSQPAASSPQWFARLCFLRVFWLLNSSLAHSTL